MLILYNYNFNKIIEQKSIRSITSLIDQKSIFQIFDEIINLNLHSSYVYLSLYISVCIVRYICGQNTSDFIISRVRHTIVFFFRIQVLVSNTTYLKRRIRLKSKKFEQFIGVFFFKFKSSISLRMKRNLETVNIKYLYYGIILYASILHCVTWWQWVLARVLVVITLIIHSVRSRRDMVRNQVIVKFFIFFYVLSTPI